MNEKQEKANDGLTPPLESDDNPRYRLEMSPLERKVLITMAVSGEPETPDDLVRATGIDPEELEGVITRLSIRGIITLTQEDTANGVDASDEIIDQEEFEQISRQARSPEAEEAPAPQTGEEKEAEAKPEGFVMAGLGAMSNGESVTQKEPVLDATLSVPDFGIDSAPAEPEKQGPPPEEVAAKEAPPEIEAPAEEKEEEAADEGPPEIEEPAEEKEEDEEETVAGEAEPEKEAGEKPAEEKAEAAVEGPPEIEEPVEEKEEDEEESAAGKAEAEKEAEEEPAEGKAEAAVEGPPEIEGPVEEKEAAAEEGPSEIEAPAGETKAEEEAPPEKEAPAEKEDEAAVEEEEAEEKAEEEPAEEKEEAAAPAGEEAPPPLDLDSLKKLLASMETMHYYEMLKIDPQDDRRKIRRSYYRLAKHYHPDQHQEIEDEGTLEVLGDIFSYITMAYETLHSNKRRRLYDRTIPEVTGAQETEEEEALSMIFDESTPEEKAPAVESEEADEETEEPLGWSFYQTALADFQMGEYKAAELNFKLAASMDPNRREYQEGLKRTAQILNEQVVTELKKEASRLEEDRRFREAITTLSRAVKVAPEDADLHYNLARIRYLKTMERDRAEEDLARALECDPGHIDTLLLLGRVQAVNGDTRGAISTFKHVLTLEPDHPKAQQALELFEK